MVCTGMITRLGINAGDLILEIGEDSDCDQELRKEIFATSGNQPVGDDDGEVVDVVLLWWREEDGDLVKHEDSTKHIGVQ